MNISSHSKGVSKTLYKYFSYQSRRTMYRNKIKRLIKEMNCDPLTSYQKSEIKKYYASFGLKNIDTSWHQYYTHISGKFYKEYIPEDLFFNVIEPHLNMTNMMLALADKNLLNRILKGVEQPQTVINNINGFYFFEDGSEILSIDEVVMKCGSYSKLVIKPSIGSYGGKDVLVFSLKDGITDYNQLTLKELIVKYDKDFVIQKWVEQHEKMSLLNPKSVNTIRIKSLLINDKVQILNSIVRVGGVGSFVDNTSKGGIYGIINSYGSLKPCGFSADDERIYETGSKVKFSGFEFPGYEEVKRVVKKLHMQIPYFRMVSWDIAINSEENPVLIEYNVTSQGVHAQFAYGPLFGMHTDAVLNNVKSNKFKTEVRHILNVSYI